MNTFLDFLSDNTFFAIFSGVIIVLVIAFIITLIKGKKETKSTIDSNNKGTQEDIVATSSESNINKQDFVIESQLLGTNSPDTGYHAAITSYIPDLNEEDDNDTESLNKDVNSNMEEPVYHEPIIPDINEISTSVSHNQENVMDIPAQVTMNHAEDLAINDYDNMPIPNFSIKDEDVAIEPINEEALNDEMKISAAIEKNPDLAFGSLPIGDSSINEDIKIESSQESDFNKTEIFDFPDFSKTEIDSEKLLSDVEKAVMEAANKYIDSVMKS